ncbi:formate--tetrahydrofolate ligase [Flavobacterium sp. TSSA_36]|uniref:formate--tetrahydrofolate ligase n=1 Tax=Flavobacterium sp. TSSA_36 TaxID=3447669 RepID=UPI003F34098A
MSLFPSDIEIAQKSKILSIKAVAHAINIQEEDLELYGKYKAKLPLQLLQKEAKGKLILVSAMSPTKYGEGKTTMTIGLTDGLNKIGKKAIAVLREPSLGPVFGLKGGAAGGGYAQVLPMEDINLHFTGDFSAIEKANNLLSAIIDNYLHHGSSDLHLDPKSIVWKRVMDMNDRALRQIIIGVGAKGNGVMREENFNITPASEIMAIVCLAEGIADLKRRLGNIYVGKTVEGQPVFARDLNVVGAMAALLKEAIKPNLVQTIEGNPAILHGGPFASIAQGTNSVIATKMGLSLGEYVVTEAGFGADLGAEKFFHIKCEQSGLRPDAVVLVATLKAIKHHAGLSAEECKEPNINAIKDGFCNLEKHIENIQKFGIQPVVCINAFPTDTQEEYHLLIALCAQKGANAVVSTAFADGGKGAEKLAQAIVDQVTTTSANYQPLYVKTATIASKIETIATEIYGASSVEYSAKAKKQLKTIIELGFEHFSICMVKTPASFSDDEKKIGSPAGFTVTVREFEFASGAGFVIPLLGEVMRMPGLPKIPNATRIDIDDDGVISGLS